MKHLTLTLKSSDLQDTGQFEGYASTFGNVDQGGDLIEPGAFRESVAKARAEGWGIPMLWQHDQREPIGVWRDIFEDDRGLFVRGQLILDGDPVAQRAYGKLKHGALGGLSIGYTIPKGGAAPDPYKAGVLRLKKIDLREISLVTMPMNTEAKVTAVKTVTDGQILPSLPDFENFLREAGFSKSQATAIAGKGLKSLLRSESGSESNTDFLSALAAQIRG